MNKSYDYLIIIITTYILHIHKSNVKFFYLLKITHEINKINIYIFIIVVYYVLSMECSEEEK